MQARNFTTNVPKILDLKSSSEQIFPRKLSLGAPDQNREINMSRKFHVIRQFGLVFPVTVNQKMTVHSGLISYRLSRGTEKPLQ